MPNDPGELIRDVTGPSQVEKEAILTCAVVGPDDDGFRSLVETVIEPTLAEIGFRLLRGGGIGRGGLRNLRRALGASRWVIVDMTGSDTSVAYALGAADAANCTTILLARDVDEIPPEMRSRPLVLYDDDEGSRATLALALRRTMLLLGIQLAVPAILLSRRFVGTFAAEVVDVTVRLDGRRGAEATFREQWNLVAQRYEVEELYRVIQSDGELVDVSVQGANAEVTQIQTDTSMVRIRPLESVPVGETFSYELEYEIQDGFSGPREYWNYSVDCETEQLDYSFDFPLFAVGKFTAEVTPKNGSTRSLEARRTRLPKREAFAISTSGLGAGDRIAFSWEWTV